MFISSGNLARVFVLAGFACGISGCMLLVAPPELTPEVQFVSDNEADFVQPNDAAARIIPGAEVDLATLDGCWGTIATYDLDLTPGLADNPDPELASLFLSLFGPPAFAVEEVGAYVFDSETRQMEWHILTRGRVNVMLVNAGQFELLDGNRIQFDIETLTTSNPADGSTDVFPSRSNRPAEWLIAVEGDTLRLEAFGDFADPEDTTGRDGFVYHRFPCP